jgi:hypothetical protein
MKTQTKMDLTQTTTTSDNSRSRQDKNSSWRERAHLLLDASLDDALERKSFHGQVVIDILIKENFVIGFNSELKQTIRH